MFILFIMFLLNLTEIVTRERREERKKPIMERMQIMSSYVIASAILRDGYFIFF